jgi:hypothetical protein
VDCRWTVKAGLSATHRRPLWIGRYRSNRHGPSAPSITIWPARYPDAKRLETYGNKLSRIIANDLVERPEIVHRTTDPDRFTDIDLSERELSYGRSGFSLPLMLDTRLSDAERYPLKLADLVVMDTDREKAPVGYWAEQMALIQADRQADAAEERLMSEIRKTHEVLR